MSLHPRIRTIVRSALALGILAFTAYTLTRIAVNAADAVPLAVVSAALLLVLLVAVTRTRRA